MPRVCLACEGAREAEVEDVTDDTLSACIELCGGEGGGVIRIDSLIRDGETMPEMCDELVVRWGPVVLEMDGERRVDAFGEEGT